MSPPVQPVNDPAAQLWSNAMQLRAKGWKPQEINDYLSDKTEGRVTSMVDLAKYRAQTGSNAPTADEWSPNWAAQFEHSAPGAALLGFGKGASFGFDDRLAGLVSAATGGSYTGGRDEARQALGEALQEHPLAAKAGLIGGGLASGVLLPAGKAIGAGSFAQAVGRGALMGGAGGLLTGLGYTPDLTNPDVGGLLKQTAIGAGLGAGITAGIRGLQNVYRPSAYQLETRIETPRPFTEGSVSGEGTGTGPLPGEVQMPMEYTPSLTMEARGVSRMNPEAQQTMAGAVTKQLNDLQQSRQALSAGYDALQETPIANPKVQEILARPEVQKVLKEAERYGLGPPPEGEPTFGIVNGIRRQLRDLSEGFSQSDNAFQQQVAPKVGRAAKDLDAVLRSDENVGSAYSALQSKYGAAAQRAEKLEGYLKLLGGNQSRGRMVTPPGTSARHMLFELFGINPFKVAARAAAEEAPLLTTPMPMAEFLKSIEGLRTRQPWPQAAGGAYGLLNTRTGAHSLLEQQ